MGRHRLTGKTLVAAAAVVVILAGAATAAVAARSNPVTYRLATVTTGSTTAALTEVGTISPVNQSTVSFPIAGQVAAVDVRPGQTVSAGQTLATLNASSLTAQRASARAATAAAEAKLVADQAAQAASANAPGASKSGATATRTAATSLTPGAAKGHNSSTTSAAAITTLQHALITGQHRADTALTATKSSLDLAAAACQAAPPTATTPAHPNPSLSSPAAHTGTAQLTTPSSAASGIAAEPPGTARPADSYPACAGAQTRALAAETTTYHDETAVAGDINDLDSALRELASAPPTATASSTPSTADKSSPGSSGTGSAGSGGAAKTTVPITAGQLAADQSSVDATIAAEKSAQQNLDQASLRSTAAGEVEAVTLNVGDQISASSTTETVVISSPGARQAVIDVPVTGIASVAIGQRANVTPDGTGATLTGKITFIAALPTAGTTAAYPVTVVLDGTPAVPDGASARVTLLTSAAAGAVVVPTSAITATGHRSTVQVDNHGTLSTVAVVVGTSGPIYTQIISGLRTGQQVVLADLATPIPTTTSGVRGLGGGVAGGGTRRTGG